MGDEKDAFYAVWEGILLECIRASLIFNPFFNLRLLFSFDFIVSFLFFLHFFCFSYVYW